MDKTTEIARSRGLVPDWAWYQLNGKSAHQNWMEQKEKMVERFANLEDSEADAPAISFLSEVKVK